MSAVRLSVMGIGNVRFAVPVIVSLATYYGERPLSITFYDADEERLDLFDRFARLCFEAAKSSHSLRSVSDPVEALEEAQRVLLHIDENCARKQLGTPRHAPDPTPLALEEIRSLVPEGAEVWDLAQGDWPQELDERQRLAVPHQVLRILNREEYAYELFRKHAENPLKGWLDALSGTRSE